MRDRATAPLPERLLVQLFADLSRIDGRGADQKRTQQLDRRGNQRTGGERASEASDTAGRAQFDQYVHLLTPFTEARCHVSWSGVPDNGMHLTSAILSMSFIGELTTVVPSVSIPPATLRLDHLSTIYCVSHSRDEPDVTAS